MKLPHLLLLPLCACALVACGGGGGGSAAGFDATNWAAHPGAEVEAEQSTVDGEVLAGKTMTVRRINAADNDSDTTLAYSFTAGKNGSYARTTEDETVTQVITAYTYKATSKTAATLTVDISQTTGTTRHEYKLAFNSAKTATGILTIQGSIQDQLTVTFQ